jgi:translation elongation factor EF-Ts
LGGKRKDPKEVIKTMSINLKQKVITEMEKEGNPKHIIEKMVNERYSGE